MKKLLLILFVALLLVGCENNQNGTKKEEVKPDSDYGLNETFKVMEFEVTVKNDIKVIEGDIIKIPVEIKNTGNEPGKLSMFYYKFYNSNDEEIDSKGSSYDDALDYASSLNQNESYVKYLYYPKGEYKYYYIEFNDTFNKYKVGIEI